jgi:hypothetical protein
LSPRRDGKLGAIALSYLTRIGPAAFASAWPLGQMLSIDAASSA